MLSMKHHLPYIVHCLTIINKTILFFNPKAPKEKLIIFKLFSKKGLTFDKIFAIIMPVPSEHMGV